MDFSSHTRDGKQIVVSVRSDTDPGELYLYDRSNGSARFLMRNRDWIDPAKSASVRPFTLRARDGLTLHGYLTLPNGSDGRNLPLIVNPHGGPIGPRDNWGYNWETQMFASRGYAVLQVNFRGSGGYGKAFRDAGHMNWADGIQDDIIDATRWAIAQGHADPERICIYGGSFGGYSALMAPAREPGLFKCAFGYVGLYDVDRCKRGDIRIAIRACATCPHPRHRSGGMAQDVTGPARGRGPDPGLPRSRRARRAHAARADGADEPRADRGWEQAGRPDHPVRRDARFLRREEQPQAVHRDAGVLRPPHRREVGRHNGALAGSSPSSAFFSRGKAMVERRRLRSGSSDC